MPDKDPIIVEGQRLLGVVPGKPAAGDRKELKEDDAVMVWPHLLVRHAVAALVVLFVVLVLALAFDAPLRSIADPAMPPTRTVTAAAASRFGRQSAAANR